MGWAVPARPRSFPFHRRSRSPLIIQRKRGYCVRLRKASAAARAPCEARHLARHPPCESASRVPPPILRVRPCPARRLSRVRALQRLCHAWVPHWCASCATCAVCGPRLYPRLHPRQYTRTPAAPRVDAGARTVMVPATPSIMRTHSPTREPSTCQTPPTPLSRLNGAGRRPLVAFPRAPAPALCVPAVLATAHNPRHRGAA